MIPYSYQKFILLASVVLSTVICSNSTIAQETNRTGAKPAATRSNQPLIKTSKESIALDEFEAAYRRMNDKDPYGTTLDSLKDFLTIYADYRLKLLEARELALDQDPKIQKEIEGYRTMLAGPFVLDKEVTEPNVKKIWDRRQYEVNASHFLAQTRSNNPADTLKAYNRALKAIEKLNNGEIMSEVVLSTRDYNMLTDLKKTITKDHDDKARNIVDSNAWEGSDDKSSSKNSGELGYFTGGQTVRPFEDAVFKLKVGEYTKVPVRTRYGYHVIQLIDKIPRIGGLKVHHILVNMAKGISGPDTLKYYHKADSLLHAIRAGAKFETVAQQSSDDKLTAAHGGEMDIDREMHRTQPSFDKVAYTMKDGEISDIVKTTFGYHIIKRDAALPAKTFDQEKDGLKKSYKQNYYNDDKVERLAIVRKQENARIIDASLNAFMSRIDSSRTTLDSGWSKKFTPGDRNLTLYEIAGKKWTIGSMVDSLAAQPGTPLTRASVIEVINRTLDDQAVDILALGVSKRFPEFENIMADYKNGITLFELENKRIWSKVVPDSAKERKYYEERKAKFLWPERVDVSEIYVYNDSIANLLYKKIMDGANFDTLAKHNTERQGFKEKAGHWGLLTKDENEMSKRVFGFNVDDVKQPFSFQAGFSIVKINRRVPVSQKTFEEARQEVATQYQDDLSNDLRLEWVTELRKKYNRQINSKIIEDAWNQHRSAKLTD
ncbi:MAG: peptidylprolyl isomerase [bacterium]